MRGWLARQALRRTRGQHSHGEVREVIVLRHDDSLARELADLRAEFRARMADYDAAFAAMPVFQEPGYVSPAVQRPYLVRNGSEDS